LRRAAGWTLSPCPTGGAARRRRHGNPAEFAIIAPLLEVPRERFPSPARPGARHRVDRLRDCRERSGSDESQSRVGRHLIRASEAARNGHAALRRREPPGGCDHAAGTTRQDCARHHVRQEGQPQAGPDHTRFHLSHLLDVQARDRGRDDDALRRREVATRRSGVALHSPSSRSFRCIWATTPTAR
jgi:hypothetical protein